VTIAMNNGSRRGTIAFGLWLVAVAIGLSAPFLRMGNAVPLITGLLASSGVLAVVSLNRVVNRRHSPWSDARARHHRIT
jgi:hypothetical protein